MTDLFGVSIHFNGEKSQMFKVRYINVMLKGLKDQLDEINQGLNPGDTRRVKSFGTNVQRRTTGE